MEFHAVDARLHVYLVFLRWLVCGQMGAQTPRTARQVLINAETGEVPIRQIHISGKATNQDLADLT